MGKMIKCGEIFIETNSLLIKCNLCSISVKNFSLFPKHLMVDHSVSILLPKSIDKNILISTKYNSESDTSSSDIPLKNFINPISNYKQQNIQINESKAENRRKTNFQIEIAANVKREKSQRSAIQENEKSKEQIKPNTNLFNSSYSIKCLKKLKKESLGRQKKLPAGYWRCLICGQTLKLEFKEDHLKTHKKFICESCGKGFDRRFRLTIHIRTHTGERPFGCPYCSKTFTTDRVLKQHERTHLNLKPFKCNSCLKTFTTKNSLFVHEKSHSLALSTYECDLCPKKFPTEQRMFDHRGRHKFEGKTFQCSQCPKSFALKYNLTAHIRLSHKGEFNYKCDYCDKVFIQVAMKRSHQFMHTRVGQPFQCNLCEKKYATNDGLRKHKKRDHKPDLPPIEYRCNKCDMVFQENQKLYIEHCRKHNFEEYKNVCNYCGDRLDSEINLKNHIKIMHHF